MVGFKRTVGAFVGAAFLVLRDDIARLAIPSFDHCVVAFIAGFFAAVLLWANSPKADQPTSNDGKGAQQ